MWQMVSSRYRIHKRTRGCYNQNKRPGGAANTPGPDDKYRARRRCDYSIRDGSERAGMDGLSEFVWSLSVLSVKAIPLLIVACLAYWVIYVLPRHLQRK